MRIKQAYRRMRYSMLIKDILHIFAMQFPNDGAKVFFYRMRGTKIGKNVGIAYGVFMEEARPDLITIEDNVQIGPMAKIITHDSSYHCVNSNLPVRRKSVIIKKNSFLGAGSTILPGVTVGEKSIVAAGAVVTKDVPSGAIVAGIPAKRIKKVRHG